MADLRHDALTDRFVIVAPGRDSRPGAASTTVPTAAPRDADCPFCPGNEHLTPPEVARAGEGEPDTPGWRVRVVPNKYPIVRADTGDSGDPGGSSSGDGDAVTGVHEVVVLSPAHDRSLAALSRDQAVEVFVVLRDRAVAHQEAGRTFVQVAVNHGAAAGASLPHPHAQLVALDLVPPGPRDALARLDDAGTDLVAVAIAGADDLAVTTGAATAWCPRASGAPFTVRVAHRSTRARFEDATDAEVDVVAEACRDALARLAATVGDVPYNLVVHGAPPGRPGNFHWYVEITPRLATVAGFEMGTGLLVNPVAPEVAAARLREVAR